MIEDVLGAERARAVRLLRRGRREHPRAEVPRELDRGLADAAAAREHEDDVAFAQRRRA